MDGAEGGRIKVLNPADNSLLAEVAQATGKDVDAVVDAARRVVSSRALTAMRPMDRGRMVIEMGRMLRARKEELAQLLTLDAGKRISEALDELEGAAKYFEYNGGMADKIEGRYIPLGDGYADYAVPVPYGVTAHIIPLNFPNNMIARSLAHADVYDEVVARMAAVTEALKIGPGIEDSDITPLISAQQLDRVESYAQIGIQEGARAVTGGTRLAMEKGNYIRPTVLADVTQEMRVNQEEIFGPVMTVSKFETMEEALAIANGTDYGLSATVFTNDLDKALWMTERLEAGQAQLPVSASSQSQNARPLGWRCRCDTALR